MIEIISGDRSKFGPTPFVKSIDIFVLIGK